MCMKKVVVCDLLVMLCFVTQAQTVAEWTRQKTTQLKYLRQQIASLQVYIGYVQKGYAIAKDGLTFIGDVKDGEFSLHKKYFASLAAVSPVVRRYAKVRDIIRSQERLLQLYQDGMKQARASGQFTGDELAHIHHLFSALIEKSAEHLVELAALLQDGSLTMTDHERLQRMDALSLAMKEKERLATSFNNENLGLAMQRLQEMNEGQMMQKLYGLNE